MMILVTMFVIFGVFFMILLVGFLIGGFSGVILLTLIVFMIYAFFASMNTPSQIKKDREKEDAYVEEYGTIQYWEDKNK